eukprot:COSAG01_NODE_11771_length_1861_cov_83.938706_2_plen_491_part_01
MQPAARDERAAGGEMAASDGGLVVRMLQEEITKRDKWLVEKDEQMREQMRELLRAKDEQMREKDEKLREQMREKDEKMREQMREKDEQMRDLLRTKDEQLREKDEQMRELVRAKDEQVSGLVASMSPASHISSASHHFPASPLPYASPQPPSSPAAAAVAAAERRHTRRAHLRAEEAPSRQQVPAAAGRDHSADGAAREGAATPAMSALTVALSELQGSGAQAALTAVLEHGLEALESIPRVPRKEKQAVRRLCEQVESTLEELDADQATQLAEQCEAAELAELHRALGAVSGMGIGLVGMECVEGVESLLTLLKQCSDPVMRAGRALDSVDAKVRIRGLETLRGLSRVVLAEPVQAEISVTSIVRTVALDVSLVNGEQVGATMAVFVLCFRNGHEMADMAVKSFDESVATVFGPVFSDEMSGHDGVQLLAAFRALTFLHVEFIFKSETISARAAAEKQSLAAERKVSKLHVSASRFSDLFPVLLQLMNNK